MKISQQSNFVGFLVALATLGTSSIAEAKQPVATQPHSPELAEAEQTSTEQAMTASGESSSIEQRMARLSDAFQSRVDDLPIEDQTHVDRQIAQGWADGRRGAWLNGRDGSGWGDGRGGRGAWLNNRDGGWADGRGGSFLNSNRWRNGWRDRGSFRNWWNGWGRRR
ncbi:MAG: GrrA/OscA1 family cyclophane-containing rSAM-modified RiPP [Cyanobacteria bacterium J06621_11]